MLTDVTSPQGESSPSSRVGSFDQPPVVRAPTSSVPQAPRRRPSALMHWLLLLAAITVVGVARLLNVRNEHQVIVPIVNQALPGLCTYRELFGVECPGCGMTRCFISLAHGRLASAWHYNPVGLVIFTLVAGQIPYRTLQIRRIRRDGSEYDLSPWALWMFGIVMALLLVQWVVRFY